LEALYGKPVFINGIPFFADPQMPEHYVLDPAAWARAACPVHGGFGTLNKESPDDHF
jgi:hypothetical protein